MSDEADKPKGYECIYAIYATSRKTSDDLLVIKENIHQANGDITPNIRLIKNYKRDFYITKPSFRNHQQKKEWEKVTRLDKYSCTQSQLADSIKQALGAFTPNNNLRIINRSPYVYGSDITTTSLIKNQYQTKFPDCISPQVSVAAYDTETDVLYGTNEVIMASLTFKDKVVTGVVRSFFDGESDVEIHRKINLCFNRLLADDIKERNLKLEFELFDNAGGVCDYVIRKGNEYMPDFITIWNIDFDIPKTEDALKKYHYNLADTFSHPAVPSEYRFYNYKQGKQTKAKADGQNNLHWADQWHQVQTPSGSYWVDSACIYRTLRVHEGMVSDYSLDATMKRHLKRGKLKIPELDGVEGLEWHEAMQSRFKYEYVIYNIFDCIGLEILDEKLNDINKFYSLTGISDLPKFKSGPSQIADDMNYFVKEKEGYIIASVSDKMEDELDKYVTDRRDWIVTLPSYMNFSHGIRVVPGQYTVSYGYAHGSDLDVEGTYPRLQAEMNISRETTAREVVSIEGIEGRMDRRWYGIDATSPVSNALEIASIVHRLPSPDEVLEMFIEEHA